METGQLERVPVTWKYIVSYDSKHVFAGHK